MEDDGQMYLSFGTSHLKLYNSFNSMTSKFKLLADGGRMVIPVGTVEAADVLPEQPDFILTVAELRVLRHLAVTGIGGYDPNAGELRIQGLGDIGLPAPLEKLVAIGYATREGNIYTTTDAGREYLVNNAFV